MDGSRAASLTSPRLRGEVDCAQRSRVRGTLDMLIVSRVPLTPTLSPERAFTPVFDGLCGRGSAAVVWQHLYIS